MGAPRRQGALAFAAGLPLTVVVGSGEGFSAGVQGDTGSRGGHPSDSPVDAM